MKIIMRGAVEWALGNPVLEVGEIGLEAVRIEDDGSLVFDIDPETGQAVAKFKSGDGETAWNALRYAERLLFISKEEFYEIAEEAKRLAEEASRKSTAANTAAVSAQETAKSAIEKAGARHAASHAAAGADRITPDSIGAAHADHSHNDLNGEVVGDMRLWPFRPDDLPQGWYFGNGDQYDLASPQGEALNSLNSNYKADWNIVVTGDYINLPNLFYSDGRGYFFRAVDGTSRQVGSPENDAQRRLTGNLIGLLGRSTSIAGDGVFANIVRLNPTWTFTSGAPNYMQEQPVPFDSAYSGNPTGPENVSLNVGLTPAVYLGV